MFGESDNEKKKKVIKVGYGGLTSEKNKGDTRMRNRKKKLAK